MDDINRNIGERKFCTMRGPVQWVRIRRTRDASLKRFEDRRSVRNLNLWFTLRSHDKLRKSWDDGATLFMLRSFYGKQVLALFLFPDSHTITCMIRRLRK